MTPKNILIISARSGFTLIELMISLALGSLVIYTAAAGFRAAAQSFTIAQRLALENAIMRSGLEQANERVDFWTDCDNPYDQNQQQLRTPAGGVFKDIGGAKNGLPFSPMKDVFPLVRDSVNSELTRGWDPKETWSAHDSRVWFHGDLTSKMRAGKYGGYYNMFCNTAARVVIKNHSYAFWWNCAGLSDYGTVDVPHTWLMGQIWGMHQALGFYGYADYMPSNTLYVAYGPVFSGNLGINLSNESNLWGDGVHGGNANTGEILNPLVTAGDGSYWQLAHPNSRFNQASETGRWFKEFPNGLGRLTQNGTFALVSPTFSGKDAIDAAILVNNAKEPLAHQWKFAVGHQASQAWLGGAREDLNQQFDRFLKASDNTVAVLDSEGPVNWPKATVTIKRFIKNARFVNLCSMRWTSPLTGSSAELNFTAFGTTLRGARQQRSEDPNGGWARWNGPNDSSNSTTLDGKL